MMDIADPLPENATEHWERPPAKDKGDLDASVIYLEIGNALTVWEGIENSLVRLFCHFVEPRVSNAVERAYGSISSSDARMEALVSAAEVYFHIHKVSKELQAEFNLIIRHFKCARGRRNELAHAVVMGYMFSDNENAGNFLIPAMYSTRKTHAFRPMGADRLSILRNKYRYTSDDIGQFKMKFLHLGQALLRFHGRLAAAHPYFEEKLV